MTFWDFCAPFYNFAEMMHGAAYTNMIKTVRRFVPFGATVLDVACGTGNIALSVANKAWKVTGVDASVPMLKIARHAAKLRRVRNVKFGAADIYALGAKDGGYDVVIASQILHMLDDPEKAATELMRVARKRVIIPMALTRRDDGKSGFVVSLYKLAGFRPKIELNLRDFAKFLSKIGFNNCRMIYINGVVPMAVAIWEAREETSL